MIPNVPQEAGEYVPIDNLRGEVWRLEWHGGKIDSVESAITTPRPRARSATRSSSGRARPCSIPKRTFAAVAAEAPATLGPSPRGSQYTASMRRV